MTNVIVEMRLGSNDLALIEQKCGCDTNIMQEIDVAKKGKANEDRGFDRETFLKAEEADLVRALGELRFERFEVIAINVKVLPFYYAARVQLITSRGSYFVYLVKVNNHRWRSVALRRFVI